MILQSIKDLVQYGLDQELLTKEDEIYTVNRLRELFRLEETEANSDCPENTPAKREFGKEDPGGRLERILDTLLEYAVSAGLLEADSIVYRDLFDTKIMAALLPRPSEVIRNFWKLHGEVSPRAATDAYYKFSQDSNYIRRYRIVKDQKWMVPTEYGELVITINLSKPEKDPKAIAAARTAGQNGYPKCLLCMENEGYAGRVDHPARQNHRVIPITLQGEAWGFQYSPYVYYNEHCIVFNKQHIPMKIDHSTFLRLFDFVEQFPHYILGSNADLPIVGGSILSHDHFQGGNFEFPMARAEIETEVAIPGFADVKAGILKWPMSVIRLRGKEAGRLAELSGLILDHWRSYTDEAAVIYAHTGGEPHNTITPIARKRGDVFEMDLVLRNNITTEEHPLGVYHPHGQLHHIKKENIGLIEVMGLAILPARLKTELELLADAILTGKDYRKIEATEKHADWADGFLPFYRDANSGKNMKDMKDIMDVLRAEVGKVFRLVLEDSGVYKRTPEGKAAFLRFIDSLHRQ